jgi:hypothetical protein
MSSLFAMMIYVPGTRNSWHITNSTQEGYHLMPDKTTIIPCNFCKKDFEIIVSSMKHRSKGNPNTKFFCSQTCAGRDRSLMASLRNPDYVYRKDNQERPKVYVTCSYCSKNFQKKRCMVKAANFCSSACNKRFYRVKEDIHQVFLSRIQKSPEPDGCWIYTEPRNSNGYGRIIVNSRDTLAHIYSYQRATGDFNTKGYSICHKCNNPPCVNPNHLYKGGARENYWDSRAAGTAPIGETNGSAKVTNDDVLEMRRLFKKGVSVAEVSRGYPQLSYHSIYAIKKNVTWKHLQLPADV